MNLLSTQSATTTPTTYQNHYNRADDSTSASYIPRMARTVPHSSTVHTIFIKKITYPMTSRPDELWILERTTDGMETWRPIETFLGNLQLTQDPRALRATANQWRLHYDVSPISPSTSTLPLYILFYHILNIPMCTSDSLSPPFRTIPTYYNHAGDAPRSTIPKALLHRFIGHRGARLHRLHQLEQLAELRHNQ